MGTRNHRTEVEESTRIRRRENLLQPLLPTKERNEQSLMGKEEFVKEMKKKRDI